MGAQLSTVAAATTTVPIDAYIAELGDLAYASDVGKSRFLKTVKAVHRDGAVVVKVFIKPTTFQIDITGARLAVKELSEKLRKDLGPLNAFPNAIGYSRVVETERAGYLVRQFIKYNLYDRISTRPFLDITEKKWIAYQILRALQTCHAHNICHGDIKSENVLVGSWKWVYLADFAPFKPTALPETDSAQFLYYFDTSQRRACYVAPERFSGEEQTLTPAHDIYSAGCVIGELFLDGQPLLTLADLFKYKRGEYAPSLESVDPVVRELVLSMISVAPTNRLSAEQYLEKYADTLFPPQFNTLWQLLEVFSGTRATISNSDAMIQHVWDNIKPEFLEGALHCPPRSCQELPKQPLPVVVSLPNSVWTPQRREECVNGAPLAESGASILLSFVCAALMSTSTRRARLQAAQLVLVLAEFVTDDVKLDVCLPYLVFLLKDPLTEVRCTTLALITHLIALVQRYSRLNAKLYSAYLLPRLQQAINPNSPPNLKAALAVCLPQLAEHAVTCEGWPSVAPLLGAAVRFLLTDSDTTVRQAVLQNADALCAVLRRQGTNEVVLSHVITYLNDKNLPVALSFFAFIARVSPLLGPVDLEQYILPLVLQTLYDDREELVAYVLESLVAIVSLGLLKMKLLLGKIVPACAKFLIHPNVYIRTQALLLVAATAQHLSDAEVFCLLRPILSPSFLNNEVYDFKDYGALISALKTPMLPSVYSMALQWASEAKNTAFWAQGQMSTSLSPEDKQYLTKLREVGFKDGDLWQLYAYRTYLWNLSVMYPRSMKPKILHGVERVRDVRRISLPEKQSSRGDEQPTATEITEPITPRVNIGGRLVGTSLRSMAPVSRMPLEMKPTVLVASVKAHRGAVQVLASHSNQRLFITGADDGMVKLWDTTLLLKGSSRPMASYAVGEPVTAGYFLGDSSVIVVGTASGSIRFLDCLFKSTDANFVFDTLQQIGEFKLASCHAIAFHATFSGSVNHGDDSDDDDDICAKDTSSSPFDEYDGMYAALYVLASESRILRVDLTTLRVTYEFTVPPAYGPLTCWLWDRESLWVLVGTLHGMLNLFDTRFRLRLQSWGIGDLQPIADISAHPLKPKWICVAGGFAKDIITVWDLHKLECREALVPASPGSEMPSLNPILETQQLLKQRFTAWNISPHASLPIITTVSASPGGVHMLTGGSDRVLRCWNMLSPHESYVVSGRPRNAKVYYTGKVGVSMRYTYEQYALAKREKNRPQDDGRAHNGSITHVSYLQCDQRDMAVSVDEVGVIKVFS